MYNAIMQYLNSFLSCSIKNLTLASLSLLFTIKIDVFLIFTSFNSHSDLFFMKAITENQWHDFLINSKHSCKKYCLHNCTLCGITITIYSRIKFGFRKGDCFVKKMSFLRVFLR